MSCPIIFCYCLSSDKSWNEPKPFSFHTFHFSEWNYSQNQIQSFFFAMGNSRDKNKGRKPALGKHRSKRSLGKWFLLATSKFFWSKLMCHKLSPSRRLDRFAWNFGNIYSSTRAIAWGTFLFPVWTPKPEIGFFAVKPTIFRHQILPWVIKKWFRPFWFYFEDWLVSKFFPKIDFFAKNTYLGVFSAKQHDFE